MHISLIFAGHLLARLGRPEVMNCINGLKQYSYAYEESGDQANEIHRAFNRARGGELELNHMASIAPRMNPVRDTAHSPSTNIVDNQQQLLHGSNGSSHVRDARSIPLLTHDYCFFFVGIWGSRRHILVTKPKMVLNRHFKEYVSW
jgi:hypothetical protein